MSKVIVDVVGRGPSEKEAFNEALIAGKRSCALRGKTSGATTLNESYRSTQGTVICDLRLECE